MKNAACTFQRLMNRVICGLEGTEIYIDDLVIHSNDWRTHLVRLKKVFEALRAAGLVNLSKCEFGKAKDVLDQVVYFSLVGCFRVIVTCDSCTLDSRRWIWRKTWSSLSRHVGDVMSTTVLSVLSCMSRRAIGSATNTKAQLLLSVEAIVARSIAEGEDLARDTIGGNSDDENSLDEVSVNPGLSLFEDHPRIGVIYTGPEEQFDDWVKSRQVVSFSSLRELMLLEEFKKTCSKELRIHLEEVKAYSLSKAAQIADEFVLTHRVSSNSFSPSAFKSQSASPNNNWRSNNPVKTKVEASLGNNTSGRNTWVFSQGNQSSNNVGRARGTCFWCHEQGHFQAGCPARMRYLQQNGSGGNNVPVSLIANAPTTPNTEVECSPGPEGRVVISGSGGEINQSPTSSPLVLKDVGVNSGNYVVLGGFSDTVVSAPLVEVEAIFPGYHKVTELAVVEKLPIPGIDGILGNDMLDAQGYEIFPIVSVTASPVAITPRASAKVAAALQNEDNLNFSSLEVDVERPGSVGSGSSSFINKIIKPDCNSVSFIEAQKAEFNYELGGTDDLTKTRFCVIRGLLYRVSRPVDHGLNQTSRVEQIVVPSKYQNDVLSLAHEDSFSGHFGVCKTHSRLAKYFWWPGLKSSVKKFVGSCETCQIMGKPNKPIPKAPLHPIPAIGDPFAELVVDMVGPLPRTKSGFIYLLIIMDRASRFPEAFPMRKITSKVVFEKLIEFFSRYGLPRKIQTDCGTNFTSKVFKGKCAELAIQHITSVPYHPESQGVGERFHQTLKSILKKDRYEQGEDWDKGLPFALFAIRNHPNSSTGIAPFELILGHKVCGPLEIFHELLEVSHKKELNVGEFVEDLRRRLSAAWKFAQDNLVLSQASMKRNYDKKSKTRLFEPGELVLVLSTDSDNLLEPRYKGPWKVLRKLSDVNYEVEAPGTKRKCRIFHINRLKSYTVGRLDPLAIVYEPVSLVLDHTLEEPADLFCQVSSDALTSNMQNFETLVKGLEYLEDIQKDDMLKLISSFSDLFQASPGRTTLLQHDVDVGSASPAKQSPYRLNPEKRDIVEKEIKYMLEHDLIRPLVSPWSSPILLVKKPDGQFRMCVDYRKVNANTKNDTFPLPRIEDCLDRIGTAKFITKLDRLKGYWQVPLSDRACEISAFIMPFGLYECKVMPFGMKNEVCTFQRLMNRVICGLEGTEIYIDDLVIHSNDWRTHLVRLKKVFEALRAAGLVVNLSKCEFGKTKVCFLGHEVGLGQVTPKQANLEALLNLQRPQNVREIRRILEIWTDHNPLVFIERMRGSNQRFLHWALQLQEFVLNIKHVRGVDNCIPDALSRMMF
ncbi:uncharacterized protein [Palaemon carinicauda]|uniref:uncharacterized protein n=1 Tax=Palaemon carinicauda TaxID=392227 RepID=UPI0035B59B1A